MIPFFNIFNEKMAVSLSPPEVVSVLPCLPHNFHHFAFAGTGVCKTVATSGSCSGRDLAPRRKGLLLAPVLSVPRAVSMPESLCIHKEDSRTEGRMTFSSAKSI